jgi:hypothetical protein
MTVRIEGDAVILEGDCGVEDAEPLARALDGGHVQRVNLALCRHLHSAVVQALLSFPCNLEGDPTEGYLTRLVLPALVEASERTATDPSKGQEIHGTT